MAARTEPSPLPHYPLCIRVHSQKSRSAPSRPQGWLQISHPGNPLPHAQNLHKTTPLQTQCSSHHQWDIHKVGLANKNRTTIETSKHTIPTGKRLIFKQLLQTQGKNTGENQTDTCYKIHTNKNILI